MTVLQPQDFCREVLHNKKAVLLDVRRPEEYAAGHLAGARNINWQNQPDFIAAVRQLKKRRTYYVYCRSGKRSHAAATFLQEKGYKVCDLAGGFLQWTENHLPVEK